MITYAVEFCVPRSESIYMPSPASCDLTLVHNRSMSDMRAGTSMIKKKERDPSIYV